MTLTKTSYHFYTQAIKRKKDILIMENFNINYSSDQESPTFLDAMFSISFSLFIAINAISVCNSTRQKLKLFDHLIQFVIKSSSLLLINLKIKISKRCYKNFDEEKFKSD